MSDNEHWHDACAVEEVPERYGKFVNCGHRSVAIFRTGEGELRVIDDFCPHAGASLAGGHLQRGCVICPWHAWMFDLETGESPDNPGVRVDTFPVRVVDGRVQVYVPAP